MPVSCLVATTALHGSSRTMCLLLQAMGSCTGSVGLIDTVDTLLSIAAVQQERQQKQLQRDAEIAEVQQKLAASETERAALQGRLDRKVQHTCPDHCTGT
jgi:hypothetical protein